MNTFWWKSVTPVNLFLWASVSKILMMKHKDEVCVLEAKNPRPLSGTLSCRTWKIFIILRFLSQFYVHNLTIVYDSLVLNISFHLFQPVPKRLSQSRTEIDLQLASCQASAKVLSMRWKIFVQNRNPRLPKQNQLWIKFHPLERPEENPCRRCGIFATMLR